MRTVTTLLLSMTLLGIGWAQQNASTVTPPSVDLHLAALQGDVEAVRQHVAAGTDLDKKDAYGSTTPMIAVTFDQLGVAETLLDVGSASMVTWPGHTKRRT